MNYRQQPADPLARAVHWSLLLGLVCSVLLMIAGLFLAFLKDQPRPTSLITKLPDLLRMAADGNGVACMELGVLVLMLTPVVRVMVLAVGWMARREGRMALVALTVLLLLAISIMLSVG
ncbi:MAG TPA: DUF1634 domain-containing protein [Pirellulales bacterium]|nr:DUF1634 domain-containing protein [Pirellulales bacterium]